MGTISRWMPVVPPDPMSPSGWALLAVCLAVPLSGLSWFLYQHRWGWGLVAVLAAMAAYASWEQTQHLRRLAADRVGEDIGTFARAFDRRSEPFDPWVVRAAWDALQPYVSFRGGGLPLRPTDRLGEDLDIDPDDIDMGLVQEIAERAGRSLENVERNPIYGRVETVGDLVRLLSSQPQCATT